MTLYDKYKDEVNDSQLGELLKVSNYYSSNCPVAIKYKIIPDFIKYHVQEGWLGRILEIREAKTKVTQHTCRLRYGDKGDQIFQEIRKKKSTSKQSYVAKFGKVKGTEAYEKSKRNKKGLSLEVFLERHGPEKGLEMWGEYLAKRSKTYQRHKKEGRSYQNGRDLKAYIIRHGEEKGKELWLERNLKQAYRFSIHFYIEKYGEQEGIEKYYSYVKTMDKNSLSGFVKRYGQKDGLEKYTNYVANCKANNNFTSKGWAEQAAQGIKKTKRKRSISQSLFWNVYELLSDDEKKEVFFGDLTGEFSINNAPNKSGSFHVDFKIRNIIVEFLGSFWHSSAEQIEKDKIRKVFFETLGYSVLEIHEKDYKKDKIETLLLIKDFIKNNICETTT